MKIEERGRARFRPQRDVNLEDITKLLLEKIQSEQEQAANLNTSVSYESVYHKSDKLNLVSLFSGCGGLDLGVELAGLEAVLGKDLVNSSLKSRTDFESIREKSIFNTVASLDNFTEANQSYRANFPDHILQIKDDIKKINRFPMADMVLGGFPCPGFSEGGPRLIDDKRNFLYIHFIRCLMQSRPLFFVAENVKGMLTLGKGAVAKQIKEDFESAGYNVNMKLINARDYGVPQLRERVFLVGVRQDIEFDYNFPDPTHGEVDGLHRFVTLEDSIKSLESNPGQYFTGSYSPIYLSRNRKKRWDEQSFTIQASGRQAPLHPSGASMQKINKDEWILPSNTEHRRLSVKEIARIQTFPDWFEFSKGDELKSSLNNQLNKQYKQIGNAVPVQLAKSIILPIANWFVFNNRSIEKYRIKGSSHLRV